MARDKFKIGIVAPAGRIEPEVGERIVTLAARDYGGRAEIVVHPQCHLTCGHFAGYDEARAEAFLDIANDESFDALWWARGGYGSNRIADLVLPYLSETARHKTYLGYSDAGFLLAGLYRAGFPNVAHGPVARDILRAGGEAAARRALAFLVDRDPATLEPHVSAEVPCAAFNLTILSHIVGTRLEPDLSDHVLMLEEVSEAMYRIDRAFFHVTSAPSMQRVAGIRLGRVSDVTENDPDFAQTEEEVAQHWCAVSGIPYLGRADIGHDVANKIVPFGRFNRKEPQS
jgi:muramoyltetrapeptide carboxypeptidase